MRKTHRRRARTRWDIDWVDVFLDFVIDLIFFWDC